MSTILLDESPLLKGSQPAMVTATKDGITTSLQSRSHKYFIIDGQALSGPVSDQFTESVKRHRHDVYGIKLDGSKIDDSSVSLITEELIPQLRCMEYFNASYLSLSIRTQTLLCRVLNPLVLGYCPILRLHLVRCGLGFKGGKMIFEALTPNVTMQELHLEGNNFGDGVVSYIVKCLSNADNTLRVLSIGHNGITAEGMEEMALTLGGHAHLQEFHCSGNPIESRGANALMNAVWNSRLSYISLSNCKITDCSWASILIYMTTLESFTLSCNDIDGVGLQDLCEGLERCCCLRHLDISYNRFHGPQASSIGHLIKSHKGLVTLNLSGVPLTKEMVNNIQLGIMGNPTLRVLDLSWCQMKIDLVKPLVEALAHNALLELLLNYNPVPPEIQQSPRTCSLYANVRRVLEKEWAKRTNKEVETSKIIESILSTINLETGVEDVSKLEYAFMHPLHAEDASSMWRKRRLLEIEKAKKAFMIAKNVITDEAGATEISEGVVTAEQARLNELMQRQIDEGIMKVHIDPSYAADKLQKEKEKAAAAMILSNTENEKCVLSISYGRKTEFIGTIEVTDEMTYYQTRPLLEPIFKAYFNTEDMDFINDVMKFKILDAKGELVPPEAEKVRIAWTELSMAGLYMNLQPANWVYIPPGDDSD